MRNVRVSLTRRPPVPGGPHAHHHDLLADIQAGHPLHQHVHPRAPLRATDTTAPPGGPSTEDTDPRARRQQSGTPEDPAPDSFCGLNRTRVQRRRRATRPFSLPGQPKLIFGSSYSSGTRGTTIVVRPVSRTPLYRPIRSRRRRRSSRRRGRRHRSAGDGVAAAPGKAAAYLRRAGDHPMRRDRVPHLAPGPRHVKPGRAGAGSVSRNGYMILYAVEAPRSMPPLVHHRPTRHRHQPTRAAQPAIPEGDPSRPTVSACPHPAETRAAAHTCIAFECRESARLFLCHWIATAGERRPIAGRSTHARRSVRAVLSKISSFLFCACKPPSEGDLRRASPASGGCRPPPSLPANGDRGAVGRRRWSARHRTSGKQPCVAVRAT